MLPEVRGHRPGNKGAVGVVEYRRKEDGVRRGTSHTGQKSRKHREGDRKAEDGQMGRKEQKNMNGKMHRQAGWSALCLEPPGCGQGPWTGKDGVGSHSRTLRITTFFFFTSNPVTHGKEAEISCANEKSDIGWGSQLEEGLCIIPQMNDTQSNT